MMRKRGVGVLVFTDEKGAPERAECEECDWYYEPTLFPDSILLAVNSHIAGAHPESSPWRQERYVTFVFPHAEAQAQHATPSDRRAEGRQVY